MARLTPLKAIRKKCLDCSGYSSNEVKLCPVDDCPLYQYRFGTNPAIKRGNNPGGNPSSLRRARKSKRNESQTA